MKLRAGELLPAPRFELVRRQDLDSNPTQLIEIVEIGKQLLMTRGALTTFSIANDVAKYFAIIPVTFILAFPQLAALNVMGLAMPESAILSAVDRTGRRSSLSCPINPHVRHPGSPTV